MSKIMREMYAEALKSRQEPEKGPEKALKRYSVDRADAEGYCNYQVALRIYGHSLEVLLDGVVLNHCVMADEINGVALVIEQPSRLVGNDLALIERRGVVRVVPKLT